MLLQVRDAQNNAQLIAVRSQQTPVDRSGTIAAANTPQALLAANTLRSGWLMQNTSLDNLTLQDLGGAEAAFIVGPGAFFPPPYYPVTPGAVNISGPAIGDAFTCREW